MSSSVFNPIGRDKQNTGVRPFEGTVRVVWQGIEYIINANETKNFMDDTVAQKLAAGHPSLRLADGRDNDNASGKAGKA